MSQADISWCGLRWVLLLVRCLTALVILDGVALICSGSVLAQEPGPGGSAPAADTPIDAGIDSSRFEPFMEWRYLVKQLEKSVEELTRKVSEAEATLKVAEQVGSVTSLETARSELDTARKELNEEQRDRLLSAGRTWRRAGDR